MEFFGLSPIELVVIFVVAILVFGQRLPEVAGQAAATMQRVKRSLTDLRRETGIDQEIYKAKREFEERVARPVRDADIPGTVKREASAMKSAVDAALTTGDNVPASSPPELKPPVAAEAERPNPD